MSDTVKIIIEIPESIFDTIQADKMISREQLAILQMHIMNGTPLKDVKADIRDLSFEVTERSSGEQITLNYTVNVLDILDNIGKTESEDKECI